MDTPEVKVKLDDGSRLHLLWLTDGSLSISRYRSGSWADGQGWQLVATGTVPAETMRLFLAAQAVQGGKVNVWDA